MENLTPRQQKLLDFLEREFEKGNCPSQKEIAGHFKIAQNAVFQLVSYLKQKGYLENSGVHRGLRLSQEYAELKKNNAGLPIVGRVAAGAPILAEQNITGYMDIGEFIERKNRNAFLLKVVGDSMIEEGIMDGDYVAVRPQAAVENGQIGVALIEEEATVKRIYLKSDEIILKSANKKYKPMVFSRGDKTVRIIGKVIGCVRAM